MNVLKTKSADSARFEGRAGVDCQRSRTWKRSSICCKEQAAARKIGLDRGGPARDWPGAPPNNRTSVHFERQFLFVPGRDVVDADAPAAFRVVAGDRNLFSVCLGPEENVPRVQIVRLTRRS
jgi:hypothetical protein